MKDEKGSVRTVYIRPMVLAAIFVVAGQIWVYAQWGAERESAGDLADSCLWNAIVTVITVMSIGLMSGFITGTRYEGFVAGVIAACCYVTVLTATILICFELDMTFGLFGMSRDPKEVIGVSLALVLAGAPVFGWILHSRPGKAALGRVGL